MTRGEVSPVPYVRSMLVTAQLGSLLTASELLAGQCLSFVALLLAGGIMLLCLPLLSKLCFRGPSEKNALSLPFKWLLCLLSLVHGGVILWVTIKYLNATFLPHTPKWALVILVMIVPLYALRRSDAAMMRLCRMLFPATVFLLFLIFFYQTQWSALYHTILSLPWWEANYLPRQTFLLFLLIFLNPVVATPLLFPDLPKKDFLTSQRHAILLSSLSIGFMMLMPVVTLGIPLFETLPHPLYAAANMVVHGTPLIRVDTLLSTVFAFSIYADLTLCLQTLRLTLRDTGKRKASLRNGDVSEETQG